MQISAKGEYAIRAVLDLALQRERGLTPIQGIATRQGIPQRYLEQVLLALKRAGLLTRDPRMKERKKYGQPGARSKFQYSKR